MKGQKTFNDDQKKHIDIVESIINRMSENSKQMKEWCVALCTALVGISFTVNNRWLFAIAIIVVFLFSYLDAYYLMLERQFRRLYNDIIKVNSDGLCCSTVPIYSTSRQPYMGKKDLVKSFKSTSVWPFYIIMTICILLLLGVGTLKNADDKEQKIRIMNDTIQIEVQKPLNVEVKEFDSLNVNIGNH